MYAAFNIAILLNLLPTLYGIFPNNGFVNRFGIIAATGKSQSPILTIYQVPCKSSNTQQ